MIREIKIRACVAIILAFSASLQISCSYNPFIGNNHTTGSATGAVVGAGVGAGSVGVLGGSKSLMAASGIAGGFIGYYVTTLRYDAGGVVQSGGQVYKVGDFVGINIPSDKLFEPNTAEFLPQAENILDSAVAVLKRYPENNIIISGNTSGFSRPRWERRLSEERAKKVSSYLWNAGVNQFVPQNIEVTRKLTYVGYGDYFPIAHRYTNESIRKNSRIQITSYPTYCGLNLDQRSLAMRNMGALDDDVATEMERCLKGNSSDDNTANKQEDQDKIDVTTAKQAGAPPSNDDDDDIDAGIIGSENENG